MGRCVGDGCSMSCIGDVCGGEDGDRVTKIIDSHGNIHRNNSSNSSSYSIRIFLLPEPRGYLFWFV